MNPHQEIGVLPDHDLEDRLERGELLRYPDESVGHSRGAEFNPAEYKSWSRKSDEGPEVRSASLNLTVGWIYLPETQQGKPGSVGKPLHSYLLAPGRTAVVETRELVVMPDDCAGLVFTRPALSSRGLLLTNPGHVDPGFQGPLFFTVINMGQDAIELRRSRSDEESWLANLTVISCASKVRLDWLTRKSGGGPKEGKSESAQREAAVVDTRNKTVEAALKSLSADFMNVEKRAVESARREVTMDTVRVSVVIAVLFLAITIVGMVLTFSTGADSVRGLRDDVARLTTQVQCLQTSSTSDECRQLTTGTDGSG